MSIITKVFRSKEIKRALAAIEQADEELGYNMSFYVIDEFMRKDLSKQPNAGLKAIKEAGSPIQWAFVVISNITGDMQESGRLHLCRGVLNPNGLGADFWQIYIRSVDKLVEYGSISKERGVAEKKAMAEIIKSVG